MKNFLRNYLFGCLLLVLTTGCRKDDNSSSNSGAGGVSLSLSGIVLDENNLPIAGVNISASGFAISTNKEGVFFVRNFYSGSNRCILSFEKPGYFIRTFAFKPLRNSVNYVRIVLQGDAPNHSFIAVQGGLISLPDNSSVLFAPNSIVNSSGNAYSGTVNVTFKHLSPDSSNFGFLIPGGDLAAINSNGEDVMLYSFGMLGVLLKSPNGENLQLASGSTATITIPVAQSQLSQANPTIPLWYFDEPTSLWREQGYATLSGNKYIGTVTHFSWWNIDYQGPRSTIKGKVVDCAGQALSNVNVTINGWYVVVTNSNGEYVTDLPVNMLFSVQVLASNNGGFYLNSQIENVPLLNNGQIYTVPDLIVPCPTRVSGIAKKCNGETTDAAILLKDQNGAFVFSYSTTGEFNIPVIPGTNYDLKIFNGTNNYYQQIITNSNINLGVVNLCNVTLSLENFLTVTDAQNGPKYYEINSTLIADAVVNGQNSVLVSVEGVSIPALDTIKVYIALNDTLTGYHSWANNSGSGITINILNDSLGGFPYPPIFSNNLNGGITVNNFGNIGEIVEGVYSGNAYRLGDTVTISGKFQAIRFQ